MTHPKWCIVQQKKREDSYAMEIEKLKAMIQATSEQPARKKKGFFKKGKTINNDVSMEPVAYISNEPLSKNFVLRDYLISKSNRLASSQLEVISLAVKCNVTDEFAKKMIDMATNGSDSIALKSVLEVELAKRNEATKINMDDIAECDIYE